MKKNNDKRKNIIIIILIVIILLLLYLLIRYFGHIENHGPKVPTGNIDIFEIDCTCGKCEKSDTELKKEKSEQNDTNKNKSTRIENKQYKEKNSENIITNEDIVVFDNYKMWDNKKLRIFSNPAYEYQNKIAPGSENSYVFKIKNNNNFDVLVDISFNEENSKNINMKYKLRNDGNYLIGTSDNYAKLDNMTVSQIIIPAKSEKKYTLDWKWIDSDNDTEIGFDISANYKLSIKIGANQR